MLCQQSNRGPTCTCTSVYDRYIIACRLNATLSSVSPRGNGNVKPLFPFITFYEWVNHEHFFLLYGVASSQKHLPQNNLKVVLNKSNRQCP